MTQSVRGWRGHGYAGVAGMDLQNSPNVGASSTTAPAQSYVTGMPPGRRALRPVALSMPNNGTGVPGTPIGYQAGNPGVATWDTRQQTQNPMYGGYGPPGWTSPGNAKTPGDPYGGDPQGKVAPLMPFQENDVWGGLGLANDKLVTRDRHVFLKVGYENSGRNSGQTDPPMDGPPRPSLVSINRTINWQQGSVYAKPGAPINASNGNADDATRPYVKVPTGQWIGEQGSGWSSVYGGVPGLYQPYGSYAGITAGPVKGIQSPVAEGQNGDGPHKVWSGPPHGLHSPTLPDYASTIGYYMALPAQRAPRMDRPDNSTSSGQSYSQTVQPQGQTGTVRANMAGGSPTRNYWNKLNYAPGTGWRGAVGFGGIS